jgi:hypothetical protein
MHLNKSYMILKNTVCKHVLSSQNLNENIYIGVNIKGWLQQNYHDLKYTVLRVIALIGIVNPTPLIVLMYPHIWKQGQ